MEEKKDIFDKFMSLPGVRIFMPLYVKYKEILLYLFFGLLTTVIGIAFYILFDTVCEINELIANIMSWILAVTFAYVTNRIWVFESKVTERADLLKEMLDFYGGRLVSLAVEEVIIIVFVTLLQFDSTLIKIIASVIVIILNYIISKLFVFRKKEHE